MSDMVFAQAILRSIRVSPRKLNLVAARIRGMPVKQALHYLRFCPRRVATEVYKTLNSAIANAENNMGMDVDLLYVKEAFVGDGFRLRRFLPRAKGRVDQMQKPFSHLSIKVAEKEG